MIGRGREGEGEREQGGVWRRIALQHLCSRMAVMEKTTVEPMSSKKSRGFLLYLFGRMTF